jgi:uncharacterized protein with GYD domain
MAVTKKIYKCLRKEPLRWKSAYARLVTAPPSQAISSAAACTTTARKACMATYVILFSFTQKGIKEIKDSPARITAAKEIIHKMGGEVHAFYAILGSQYDTMFILDAPNDEKLAGMVLEIARLGYVRTQTHRLFSEDEYGKIISSLP